MNLFPVDIDFPAVLYGKYSQQKFYELERQRNCELLELEPQQLSQDDQHETKIIPLEYTSEEENEDFEDEEDNEEDNNEEEDDDCNKGKDNGVNDLPCTSQTTPINYGFPSCFTQPPGLKSILKNSRSREASFYIENEHVEDNPTLPTNTHSTSNEDADDFEEEIECISYVKNPKKPRLIVPPSPTGSEADLAIAYQNNLSG
uniref:Uncharacterized protein n=1 Tax=Meloidogyne hapla TaxID=6305 RepID=A0A1I8BZI0_MELHA